VLTHGDSTHGDRRPAKGGHGHEVALCTEEDDEHSHSNASQSVRHDGNHVAVCPCTGSASDLDKLFTMAEKLEEFDREHPEREWEGKNVRGPQRYDESEARPRLLSPGDDRDAEEDGSIRLEEGSLSYADSSSSVSSNGKGLDRAEQRRLLLTAMNTFLAISIHNFPVRKAPFVSLLRHTSCFAHLTLSCAPIRKGSRRLLRHWTIRE
jgi:hypothetical protein